MVASILPQIIQKLVTMPSMMIMMMSTTNRNPNSSITSKSRLVGSELNFHTCNSFYLINVMWQMNFEVTTKKKKEKKKKKRGTH